MKYLLLALALAACASVPRHDPLYDGDPDLPTVPTADGTYIRLSIQNNRTIDATPPHFYLVGTGRFSLGVVEGYGGKSVQFVDVRELDADRCFTIVAHYAGDGDFVYERSCWRRGESISVSLDNIFVPSAAWSHR